MTKKHFILFAAEIRQMADRAESGNDSQKAAVCACAAMVCRVAKNNNPRFNEAKFRQACGLI